MATVVVKNHVRDPQTGQTYLRGVHEVDDIVAYSLTSAHPEDVTDAQTASKEELTEAATEAGADVKASDSKKDVAKKLAGN